MSRKNDMLVMVACDNRDIREHAADLISHALATARDQAFGPINKVTNIVVEHCAVKPGSMLAIMEEFQPGITNRMTKVLHPRAEIAIEHLESQSNEVSDLAKTLLSKQKLKDIVHNGIVETQIHNNAQLNHRLDVVRQIVRSERTDNIKIEELKHALDRNLSMRGQPADVQAVIEMALYGQMPDRSTNATLTYKDGKPCKTIGTF